jgi:hypothetical protein
MFELLDWVSGLVTITLLAPAVPDGVTAVIVAELTTIILVAVVPPMVTVTVPEVAKPVPAMVTLVPPANGPMIGEIDVVVGAGT